MTTVVHTSGTAPAPRAPARRRATAVALSAVASGVLLAVAWSYEFVDVTIGDSVADSVLGYDAKATAVTGGATGAVFGLVSGLAGTFTACNIAVFGVVPEVSDRGRGRLRAVFMLLGWLSAGMLAISALYGAVAVEMGRSLPQLSTATTGSGMPVRLIQASVTFGVIGLAFGYLGLVSLGYLRDPFARHPRARLVALGALIGGFLVGRPYPLFHKLLEYAVEHGNPLYGALTFVLQSIGNVLIMSLIALLLVAAMRGRVGRWLARPGNAGSAAGFALLLLGTFLIVYWDVRLPALFGYGWFPTMPWNT